MLQHVAMTAEVIANMIAVRLVQIRVAALAPRGVKRRVAQHVARTVRKVAEQIVQQHAEHPVQ